jgi:hypothetical protein
VARLQAIPYEEEIEALGRMPDPSAIGRPRLGDPNPSGLPSDAETAALRSAPSWAIVKPRYLKHRVPPRTRYLWKVTIWTSSQPVLESCASALTTHSSGERIGSFNSFNGACGVG